MAQRTLKPLDSIRKRDILAAKALSPDFYRAYAELFLKEGALDDALAFFLKGRDAAGVRHVKEQAIALGNAYLLFRIDDSAPKVERLTNLATGEVTLRVRGLIEGEWHARYSGPGAPSEEALAEVLNVEQQLINEILAACAVSEQEWWAVAAKAVSLGKAAYAAQAFVSAGRAAAARGAAREGLPSFAGESDGKRVLDQIARALDQGDTAQLLRIADSAPGRITAQDWQAAAERAVSFGNDGYAALGFLKAGQSERLAEILRRHVPAEAI